MQGSHVIFVIRSVRVSQGYCKALGCFSRLLRLQEFVPALSIIERGLGRTPGHLYAAQVSVSAIGIREKTKVDSPKSLNEEKLSEPKHQELVDLLPGSV